MKNSVWAFPYSKRFYLTHPWKWFSHLWSNCHNAYLRARYGWAPVDVWNWDQWFTTIVPQMFRYLSKNAMAYPGRYPFATPDRWEVWLLKIADLIEASNEDWVDKNNEYYDAFHNNIDDKEIYEKYAARNDELNKLAHEHIKEALNEIGEYFYYIWD